MQPVQVSWRPAKSGYKLQRAHAQTTACTCPLHSCIIYSALDNDLLYVIHTLCSHAIAACLATIVLDNCSKSGIAKATSSPPLDKTQTFTRSDVVLRKGRGGKKKVSRSIICVYNGVYDDMPACMCVYVHTVMYTRG